MNRIGIIGLIITFMLLWNMNLTNAVGDDSAVTLQIDNVAPVIVSVDAQTFDPGYCVNTSIWSSFNVTDANGHSDINLTACYVNFTNTTVTRQASSCVSVETGINWNYINCSGGEMHWGDNAGSNWQMVIYVEDNGSLSDTNDTTNMTYNLATNLNATSTIYFGSLIPGTDNNPHVGGYIIENCGNTLAFSSITGVNVSDGAGHYISATKFSLSNSSSPGGVAEISLTESSQNFSKVGGIAIPTVGVRQTWTLYHYVDIVLAQVTGTYNIGSMVWTARATA